MTRIQVLATRWDGGWELEINENQHTSTRYLQNAHQQVIDFLDTIDPNTNHTTWNIEIVPLIGDLTKAVADARQATKEAAQATESAARQSREIVRKLKQAGYTVSDSAAILGVSRGRVSQLLNS